MIIGTAGHIDHGKTTLVRALTGVDTDRLKEEKARGISIDLGFAYLPVGEKVLGFVDVPGHEKFVHTMLSGAGGIDFALLVVAADDGVMPQTREHLAILDLLGIDKGVVALTKADLADADRLAAVEAEITALLAPTGLARAPILPVAAARGDGVDALREALVSAARTLGRRAGGGRFRLAVDRSFTLSGAGTVVTGTVLSGAVKVGDRVTVSPSGLSARVRSIRAQDRVADTGVAGDRCGINLAGEAISKDAISRGDVVLDPALHAPADHIDAELKVLAGEPRPIAQWLPVRLHHAAREVGARLVLLGDAIAPGGTGKVQLVLEAPIAAAAGDRFVIRDTSAQRTIGGGRFLDLRGPRRKRRTPERIAQLDALSHRDPAEALAALLAVPPHFADLDAFARDRALSAEETEALAQRLDLARLPAGNTTLALTQATFAAFTASLMAALDAFHAGNPDLPGIGRERLRMMLEPRLPAAAFLAALAALPAGTIRQEGAWVRRADFSVKLAASDEDLWARIKPLLTGEERFRPPRVRDIAGLLAVPEPEVRRLMKLLGRMGRVDEVAHDHFFLRPVVSEMVEIITRLSGERMKDEFTAAAFRDEVQNGRKVAIQILEFFDRHGLTLRRGDLRRINPFRLDLFAGAADDAPDIIAAAPSRGREASLVGRPDFKSGRGREPVLGGFDSHSLPPNSLGPNSLAPNSTAPNPKPPAPEARPRSYGKGR